MNDKIFKNANRDIRQMEDTRVFSNYTPEHERLNMTPIASNPQGDKRHGVSAQINQISRPVNIYQKQDKVLTSQPPEIKNIINDVKTQSEQYHTSGFDSFDYTPPKDPEQDNNISSFYDIKDGLYLLMFQDEIVEVGTLEYIQHFIENLLQNNNVELSQLVVLKKVEIFSGISLKE